MDIVYRTSTGIKSSNTYDGLYSISESGVHIGIFSPLKPTIKGGNLEFITGQVDPNILGINSSPQLLVRLWERYESMGFPLEDIAQSLYFLELNEFIRSWRPHPVTLLAELIVLLDSIDNCKNMPGFDNRISRDKKKLKDSIKVRNKDKRSLPKNSKVYEKVYTIYNEYNTARYLDQVVPLELTDDVGKPDFRTKEGILIDAKMRLSNDRPAYEDAKDVRLSNNAIFSLLMKDGFAPLERTFDEQETDIAMVNLSLSPYGFMLSTSLVVDSDFRVSVNTALDLARNNEKAVIFYTFPRGSINGIYGVGFKRSIVDSIGGNLSRIDSDFYRKGNKLCFSDFAAKVNELDPGSLKHLNSGLSVRSLDAPDISQ